ncbi:hypothetical protein L6164_003502 [Bauhinia variegata]|uniref:Uncharacterized protein n=2 Tax=Bauhinia variegata TaxID=167791 RepID=A0ACB9Q1H9_BAUVA|nr:hypothetical protein L6164_003500 [Bauhinia variegata]KAI4354655.1 hypothetical protein L6164_003502 [Bauhinia variegata]
MKAPQLPHYMLLTKEEPEVELSPANSGPTVASSVEQGLVEKGAEDLRSEQGECCNGIEHLELWGDAVKWGSEFRVNSSQVCCMACKKMCGGDGGPCLCNSWVFCGDRVACGPRFGECWLKRQKDALNPDRRDSGDRVMWTSGFVFGKREGIISLETEHGTLRIKLLPECAPHSVAYILELLALSHCAGCQIHRAESRGSFWNSEGNHIKDAPFGPPFALIQGTLGARGTIFQEIPKEFCPTIKRGSIAWVGSGPEFFISLANHKEWTKNTLFLALLSFKIWKFWIKLLNFQLNKNSGVTSMFLSWKNLFH